MSLMNVMVSIVLPTYNGATYLQESLDSCLNQTYSNFELIVVDGGSTDNTLEILAGYRDKRLQVIHQADNVGRLPGALSLGFAASRGEYLTWMQADCMYTPQAIQRLVEYLNVHPEVDFVYSDFWNMDQSGKLLNRITPGPISKLIISNCIGNYHLWRRKVYVTIGDFNIDAFLVEDYEYWLRVAQKFRMEYHPTADEVMYRYRLNPSALTFQGYNQYSRDRIAARFKRARFGLTWNQYRQEMSQSYIEEAFASYRQRDFRNLRRRLAAGLLYNPVWLSNRGLISIAVESILGSRLTNKLRRSRKHRRTPDKAST